MKKTLTTLMAGLCIATTATADTWLVGTDSAFAPFEFLDEKTNQYVGFDIDLIKAVAAANGDTVEIRAMQFAGIIPAIQTNMIDVAVAGMTITEARKKQILFSDPYYDIGLVLSVKKADAERFQKLEDLTGQRICAQIGTTGAMLAKEVKGAKVVEFDNIGEAFMDLKMGGCQAVLNDKPVTDYYMTKSKNKDFVTINHLYNPEQYGFAVAKKNTKMADKLNQGLKTIKANGTYDKIHAKWFGSNP